MTEAERYISLANLKKLDPSKGQDHTDEMWHIIRGLAVLDWTLARSEEDGCICNGISPNPNCKAHESQNRLMEKYATMMRKVQQLALTVMEEQGIPAEETVVN